MNKIEEIAMLDLMLICKQYEKVLIETTPPGTYGAICLSKVSKVLKNIERYPQLVQLSNLIDNIKKAQEKMDKQDDDADNLCEDSQQSGITDTYFDKKK